MFDYDWAHAALWKQEPVRVPRTPSRLPRERVARTAFLHWQEHCVECAPPQCYASCPLYVRREDAQCRRFFYGIYPHASVPGLFEHGADIRFRRWGKLESRLFGRHVSVPAHRRLASLDRAAARAARRAARGAKSIGGDRLTLRAFASLRRRLFWTLFCSPGKGEYDDFVIECYSVETEPFTLMVEIARDRTTLFRRGFPIAPGHNFHAVPVSTLPVTDRTDEFLIKVYPENDRECRIIFSWLDFVSYRERPKLETTPAPAERVKCVAWDLDGTLWWGTLMEDGANVQLNSHAAALMKELDARGILQTVVSKNPHDEAWKKITEFGLEEYVLYPALNWGQKSRNLQQIAQELNIGIDAFAFIDDSLFERAEVAHALPRVRTYAPEEIGDLLRRPEFDVPVTETSRMRRQLYRTDMQRKEARETFSGDYETFLRSCAMKLSLFLLNKEEDVARCLELLQRSNQLNLSARAYSAETFRKLLATPGVLNVALRSTDRFGSYGIVGFASIDERGDHPTIEDFVLSCRVAQKRVEHTFFHWLSERERARGHNAIRARLLHTAKNGPLRRVFDEMPFVVRERGGERSILELATTARVVMRPVMEVRDEVGAGS